MLKTHNQVSTQMGDLHGMGWGSISEGSWEKDPEGGTQGYSCLASDGHRASRTVETPKWISLKKTTHHYGKGWPRAPRCGEAGMADSCGQATRPARGAHGACMLHSLAFRKLPGPVSHIVGTHSRTEPQEDTSAPGRRFSSDQPPEAGRRQSRLEPVKGTCVHHCWRFSGVQTMLGV